MRLALEEMRRLVDGEADEEKDMDDMGIDDMDDMVAMRYMYDGEEQKDAGEEQWQRLQR